VYDPVSAVVYAAGRRDVRQVWIDGACVVRDGRSVRVDHATVVADLKELQGVVRPR
jgi:5-methylthioadenosine/S-adenosylhomocysteine deaminase